MSAWALSLLFLATDTITDTITDRWSGSAQIRFNAIVMSAWALSFLFLWFFGRDTCSNWAVVNPNAVPIIIATAPLVAISLYGTEPLLPCDGIAMPSFLNQEFAWTAASVPGKVAARNALIPAEYDSLRSQPLFCVETAIKLFFWATVIYDYDEAAGHKFENLPASVLQLLSEVDEAMALFDLHKKRLFYDRERETKVVVAWRPDLILVCARGSAAARNFVEDAKVCRPPHAALSLFVATLWRTSRRGGCPRGTFSFFYCNFMEDAKAWVAAPALSFSFLSTSRSTLLLSSSPRAAFFLSSLVTLPPSGCVCLSSARGGTVCEHMPHACERAVLCSQRAALAAVSPPAFCSAMPRLQLCHAALAAVPCRACSCAMPRAFSCAMPRAFSCAMPRACREQHTDACHTPPHAPGSSCSHRPARAPGGVRVSQLPRMAPAVSPAVDSSTSQPDSCTWRRGAALPDGAPSVLHAVGSNTSVPDTCTWRFCDHIPSL